MTEHDCCPECGYDKIVGVIFTLDDPNDKRSGFRCVNPDCGFLFMESRCNNYGYIKFASGENTYMEIREMK